MRHLLATHCFTSALFLSLASPGYAQVTLDVPATVQIFLANQPDGTRFGADVVPTNSPVTVELVDFDPSLPLQFTVNGETAQDPAYPLGDADGTSEFHTLGPYANLDVSGIEGPLMSLLGVFFDREQIVSPPATLHFRTNAQRSFNHLEPEIQQLFYIGDGQRGFATGQYQTFQIPDGADVLYLALFDAPNNNNIGELNVTVASVPEPPALALLAVGAVGLATLRKKRRTHS